MLCYYNSTKTLFLIFSSYGASIKVMIKAMIVPTSIGLLLSKASYIGSYISYSFFSTLLFSNDLLTKSYPYPSSLTQHILLNISNTNVTNSRWAG